MYETIGTRCASRLLCNGQIITLSSVSKDGIADAMTAAWNCPYDSDQVLIVLDLGHTTTQNIIDTKKFVIGVAGNDQIELINKIGSKHGRDVGDKLLWAGAEFMVSEKLGMKIPAGCLAYIECELIFDNVLKETGVCMGRAVNIFVKKGLWNSDLSSFTEGFMHALHYVKEDTYLTGGTVINVDRNSNS